MNSEYRFERLSENNISDLLPLYFNAFQEIRSLENVKAKFDTACFGAKNLAFIAYDNANVAAAFYALFPVTIRYQQKNILAAQVGDLMTHSQHRRKGLFLELAHRTHELALLEGVQIIFTIPYGENSSYKGFIQHLNFKKIYSLNEYVIRTNSLPLATLAEKFREIKFCYSKYSNLVVKGYKTLSEFSEEITSEQNFAEILKDARFFQYKKFSKTHVVKLDEIEVWLKIKRGALVIGDIRNLTSKNAETFITALKQLCFKLGIRAAQIDVAPDSRQDIALRSVVNPIAFHYHVLILNLANTSLNDISFCLGDLDSF